MKKYLLSLLLSLLGLFPVAAQFANGVYQCDDETYTLLKKLSDSQLKNGEIFLFTTTHQDLRWLDHIEVCTINRDTMWLTPFLERLQKDPSFKMDIEQTSIVMEYIHRHSEKKEVINKHLKEGRICIGGTFIQPYEEMYSGESLARQFYLGNCWLKKNFDGYKALSYFNVDVPGRTLQMPQIMQKAGIDNLIISRHECGLFNWEAPDGSKVRTYTPGHYIYFYNVLGMENDTAINELAKESVLWYTQYNNVAKAPTVMPAMLNYEFIWDQQPVENCEPFMNLWNSIRYIQKPGGKKTKISLPTFRYAMADEFFHTLNRSTASLPTIKGERPNVWLYIHGPSHERALTASRKGDVLLPAAEKLASFRALAEGNFNAYPEKQLQAAWEAKSYPDHGWGGNGGILTDNIFRQKFEYAETEAITLLATEMGALASKVNTAQQTGRPIVIFNALSWQRNDPVTVDIRLEEGYASALAVKAADGSRLPCQLTDVTYYNDQTIQSATLHFVATAVPAMGYQTYFLSPANAPGKTSVVAPGKQIETPWYRIELTNGGISQITDKELNTRLLDTSRFLGGEIITMKSEGNGAGEFDAVQQPTMEGFDRISNHSPVWKLVETGEVFTSFTYRSKIRHAVVEQTMRVYHQLKKIDFDIAILNWEGVLYREFRMMLPLNLTNGTVRYEVPYGILEVGKDEMPGAAGERYYVENKEQRPRGIGNWIAGSGDQFGVTLSSSVAVADYKDPTQPGVAQTILQPILLASRKSCHWLGNEYNQTGDHYYHFSLTSHRPDDVEGVRFGTAANDRLQAVYNPQPYRNATLPLTQSFISLSSENVVVSAFKKCEDDNSLIIRLYNQGDRQEIVMPQFFRKPRKIVHVNLIEEEIGEVEHIVLGKYAIETYKLIY